MCYFINCIVNGYLKYSLLFTLIAAIIININLIIDIIATNETLPNNPIKFGKWKKNVENAVKPATNE